MITWPKRAAKAIQKLFESLQDLDIYIEDTNDEVFYRALIRAASGDKIKVERVISLGGRKEVLSEAKKHDHKKRRALFIVDGDLDFTKGRKAIPIIAVHCHEAYCIENLLLCQNAIATIISQELNITEQEAHEKLQYSKWRDNITEPLAELFAAFATINDVKPDVPTVSRPLYQICSDHVRNTERTIDPTKVSLLVDEIKREATAVVGTAETNRLFDKYKSRILGLNDPLYAISGKDHLLPLLGFHLDAIKCHINRKSLRIRLCTLGDSNRFSSINSSLIQASKGEFANVS
jgi:hypothetical protein